MVFAAAKILVCLVSLKTVFVQSVTEIWETTSDKQDLLKKVSLSGVSTSEIDGGGDVAIGVDETAVYQTIHGFGATLTDSSASVFNDLKSSDASAYASLLKAMFDVTPGAQSAGLSYIRVPLGASDFSQTVYSFDDQNNDNDLSSFNIDTAPSYLYSVLNDIKGVNPNVKVHLVPWSPPGWMKDNGSMDGGSFLQDYSDTMANYLYKSVEGFISKGFMPYAVSIQNEPQYQNPTLPSSLYTTGAQAAVGVSLRKLLDANNLKGIRVIGYEHNWDNAGTYATQLMQEPGASDAFAGVAFHCYVGEVGNQDIFHDNFPDKELYFTECSGVLGSDFWTDLQWYMNTLFIGGLQHWAQSGLMWNFASDPQGGPKLPGAASCGNGCRAIVTVDGSEYQLNQEYYGMAHAAKAILPTSTNGAYGKRIGVNVSGNEADSFTVGAYTTEGTSSNSTRYSVVVLNTASNNLSANIGFQGKTTDWLYLSIWTNDDVVDCMKQVQAASYYHD